MSDNDETVSHQHKNADYIILLLFSSWKNKHEKLKTAAIIDYADILIKVWISLSCSETKTAAQQSKNSFKKCGFGEHYVF